MINFMLRYGNSKMWIVISNCIEWYALIAFKIYSIVACELRNGKAITHLLIGLRLRVLNLLHHIL